MESSPKRRRLDGTGSGSIRHDKLIDFQSRDATRISTASAFILQTDELLKEAKVDYGKVLKGVDGQLHRLKSIIDSIPAHEPVPIIEGTAKFEKKHSISVPYPEPKPAKDSPYKIAYAKPAQCNVVGSYVLRTMVKTQQRCSVDMVVQMPAGLFQEKDYLNMRYFYRRAYYIAYIAAHVRKEFGQDATYTFECLDDNPLLPVLVIEPVSGDAEANGKPSKKHSKKQTYSIRIIPCAPEGVFPKSKLNASSNCNRTAEADDKTSQSPTPFYNSTVKAEATFIQYLRVLTHAKNECPAFVDACVLGRIWLLQRGFGSSISKGGFGHFEWAAMIALLLQSGGRNGKAALSTSLSATELFKAAVQFLTRTDFNRKPVILEAAKVSLDSVREAGPVLFDATRDLNLFFKMSPWSASLLQLFAKSTADLLADETADKFSPSFILKADVPLQMYDAVLKIRTPRSTSSLDRRGASWDFSLEAHRVLKKAYGDRIQLLHFQQSERRSWSSKAAQGGADQTVLLGIVFEPVNMARQMEYGPPAEEQKEAAKFRQFWGDKAELRRFKNGNILECVEWSSRQPIDISAEIARYALQYHLKLSPSSVSTYGGEFATLIPMSNLDKEAFDSARKAFQSLERDIRNLDDLPLQIRQLSPISPLSRYTSIQPPLMGFHKDSIEPMDVNLYFEASNKWPENLIAIQEAKIEFLLDFDRRLAAAHENITTYLGRENHANAIENLAYLDIVYDNGAAFRLRLHCDMEETLLERNVKNKLLDHKIKDESEAALSNLNWNFNHLPFHNQTIATFCTRLPALSQTIRLVKHWFDCHKLSGHFTPELIEIITLHVFLQSYPWKMPTSPMTGLLRTLAFLARWDWRDEPLIVDSAESLTADDRADVVRRLEATRKRDPNMNHVALFVATSHAQSGMAYTREHHASGGGKPSKIIASRMTRLAKAATKIVKDEGIQLNASQLFATSLQDYDVLIHLSSKAVRAVLRDASLDAGSKRHPSQYKNLDDRTGKAPVPMRAHPADVLIEELQRVYADTLVFFRGGVVADGSGDDGVVGAIWNPRLQARQKFRVGMPYNFKGVEGEGEGDVVEVNKDAVLLEISRIGGDLVRKIEILDED